MQVLTSHSASLASEFGVQCGRWSEYAGIGDLPFGAMWCVVPPGGRTDEDCHDEQELVIVADGTARVECGGEAVSVDSGTAVLLDSREPHVVHNRSSERPLVLLGMYWMPNRSGAVSAREA